MEEKYYYLSADEYEIPRECVVKFIGNRVSTVYPLERGFNKSDYDKKYLKEVHEFMAEDEITEREAERRVRSFDNSTRKYAEKNGIKVNTWD